MSSIENTQDHKSELKISGVGYLVKLTEKGKSEIELDYDTNTGLLTSRAGVTFSSLHFYSMSLYTVFTGRRNLHLSI